MNSEANLLWENLKYQLSGIEREAEGVKSLSFNLPSIKGVFYQIGNDTAFCSYFFSIICLENYTLPIIYPDGEVLSFFYIVQGAAKIILKNNSSFFINSHEVFTYKNDFEKQLTFEFTNEQNFKCYFITVNKYPTKVFKVYDAVFSSLFKKVEFNAQHIKKGGHNFTVLQLIERLKEQLHIKPYTISNLYSRGINLLILASFLKENFRTNDEIETTTLSTKEFEQIKDLSAAIRKHPEDTYTIQSLCNKLFLSPVKLQEGFKIIYSKTVADYIRSIRLEKAETLLKESELNISEIVYSIGLTSRSYFCKIFKLKYGCTPKEFRRLNSKNHGSSGFKTQSKVLHYED